MSLPTATTAMRWPQVDAKRRRSTKHRHFHAVPAAPLVICRMHLWTPPSPLAPASPSPAGAMELMHRAYDPLTSVILNQRETASVLPGITPWWREAVTTASRPRRDLTVPRRDEESPPDASPTLSAREWEVFALLAAGLTTRAIAAELVLAVTTVKWYIKQIYVRLGVHSRTQAVARMPHILGSVNTSSDDTSR